MKSFFLIITVLTIVFSGCDSDDLKNNQSVKLDTNQEQGVSQTFKSGDFVLQGTLGRIGILNPGFAKGTSNKYMWHFWGSKEELGKSSFKVEATNIQTGEKSKALVKISDNNLREMVWQYDTPPGPPNNGADAHLPSNMMLPDSGIWRLDTFIDNKFFGSVTVTVK